MGTKNNPGEFDCYANAEPDEPMFVLLGRDPMASALVKLWAHLRALEGEDPDVVSEAIDCAEAMKRHVVSVGKEDASDRIDGIFDNLMSGDRNRIELAKSLTAHREAMGKLVDPITGNGFFMLMHTDELGWVATFGGPYDSYTLCQRDGDDGFMRFRFDHDEGCAREWETIAAHLLDECDERLYNEDGDSWKDVAEALASERNDAVRALKEIKHLTADVRTELATLRGDIEGLIKERDAAVQALSKED